MFPDFNILKQQLMLPQLLNSGLERLLNSLIQRTEKCESYLHKLNNKVLAVDVVDLRLRIYIIFSQQRLDLLHQYSGEPDCSINVSSHVLLKLPKKSELSQYINDKSIVLNGDLQVLQDFVALIEFLEKDPAELLSHYVGDVMAHLLVDTGGKLAGFGKQKITQSRRHWGERLTEEYQLIAPNLAILDFCEQVEILEKQTSLLEHKLNKLSHEY